MLTKFIGLNFNKKEEDIGYFLSRAKFNISYYEIIKLEKINLKYQYNGGYKIKKYYDNRLKNIKHFLS
jgi:hypothetical protein